MTYKIGAELSNGGQQHAGEFGNLVGTQSMKLGVSAVPIGH